jgi:hypothetical protein
MGMDYGYDFLSMASNGYGFKYVVKVMGIDIQSQYPRIIYPLSSLVRTNAAPDLGVVFDRISIRRYSQR